MVAGSWVSFAKEPLSPAAVYRKAIDSVASLAIEAENGEQYVAAGFLYRSDDMLLTAWHAVHDAKTIVAEFSDGQTFTVEKCLAFDSQTDLALLKLQPTGKPVADLGAGVIHPGEPVYSIGSPRGYAFSITEGIVSGVRLIDGIDQVQVTCPFSPGNSGGPVLNSFGEVVAVASWSNRRAQNLNFSIPVDYAKSLTQVQVIATDRRIKDLPVTVASARTEVSGSVSAETYSEFLELLEQKRGQRVVVSVESAEGQQDFAFVAP